MDASVEHCVIQHLIGPGPENAIGLPMELQQFASSDWRLADALSESFRTHAVLDGQNTSLELLALGLVRLLRRISRYCTSLLGEREIGIPRTVGIHHLGIARKRCRNPKLLLRP